MSANTADELDFLATQLGKKQSRVIQELIHKESEHLQNEIRLAKLKSLKGMFTSLIGDEHSVQSIKRERNL